MPVTGQLSISDVVVAPGDEEVVTLRLTNLGNTAESVSIVTSGFTQGWTIVDPPNVTVPPGEERKVEVALRPPKVFSVPAGVSPLTLRIVPHDADGEVVLVEGTVAVLGFDDRRLDLPHRVERGRRRAEFDVVLENLGNGRASCRLAITDPSRRLTGRFDPPSLGVDAGDSGSVRLNVSARRRNWTRRSRSLPFEVHAIQDGHHEAIASGTLLQDPSLSSRGLGQLAVLAAILAGGAVLWAGIVRPEIDDAALRAVEQRATATTTTIEPSGGPIPDAEVGTIGTAFDTRLAVTAPLAASAVESYTVPGGKVLRITDVLWQNPNGDEGRLELMRNSSPLYGISLRNFTDYGTALVSPFVFEEGDVVSAQLRCERIGDPNSTDCSVAITITGELVDAATAS